MLVRTVMRMYLHTCRGMFCLIFVPSISSVSHVFPSASLFFCLIIHFNPFFASSITPSLILLITIIILIPILIIITFLSIPPGRKVEALRRCAFRELPPTLIIHLKRFEFNIETMDRKKVRGGQWLQTLYWHSFIFFAFICIILVYRLYYLFNFLLSFILMCIPCHLLFFKALIPLSFLTFSTRSFPFSPSSLLFLTHIPSLTHPLSFFFLTPPPIPPPTSSPPY